jgi:hypothetical protein
MAGWPKLQSRSTAPSTDQVASPHRCGPLADTLRATMPELDQEVLPALWQFLAQHPEWTEQDGDEDGWDPLVAWWAIGTSRGLLLVDPLIADWAEFDRFVAARGGCAGVVRTCHWHQRSVAAVAARYSAPVWAMRSAQFEPRHPFDHGLRDQDQLWDGIQAFFLERDDEIALWLPQHAALLFGDAMLRRGQGQLRVCPASWTQPAGGPDRLRVLLGALSELPVEHVLVSHGPLVAGDGLASLQAALR